MDTTFREATVEEILTGKARYINRPVRFRHFVRENHCPQARNGVSHRQYSNAHLIVRNGVPMVRHQGRLQVVTASVAMHGDRGILFDLRIKSEYLK